MSRTSARPLVAGASATSVADQLFALVGHQPGRPGGYEKRRRRRSLAGLASAGLAGAAVLAVVMVAALFGSPAAPCGDGKHVGTLNADGIPAELIPLYGGAAARYRLGVGGPAVLAAINRVETDFGRNVAVSSAGAHGWMQFMPATWAALGVDADGDGRADPDTPKDAIFTAARYLHASGAPHDWRRAIFAYNHATWYVDQVLALADRYQGLGSTTPTSLTATALRPGPRGEVAVDALIALGRWVKRHGYQVWENARLGDPPRPGAHAANGWHYRHQGSGAIDVNADHTSNEPARLDQLADQLRRAGWHVLWRVSGHFDHLHVDLDSGAGQAPGGEPLVGAATPTGCSTPTDGPAGFSVPDGSRLQRVLALADLTERRRIPYCYGGGHTTTPARPGPGQYCWSADNRKRYATRERGLDCSSSISMLLQGAGYRMPTLDSTGLAAWGKPGPGRHVTIWANATHAYLELRAGGRVRYWGTSTENHRHGPGWHSPRSPTGFTARHPPGL